MAVDQRTLTTDGDRQEAAAAQKVAGERVAFRLATVGAVLVVVDGIDFDDFHRRHLACGGEELHGQVGFTKGEAAGPRRAHAGGFQRIDRIHI